MKVGLLFFQAAAQGRAAGPSAVAASMGPLPTSKGRPWAARTSRCTLPRPPGCQRDELGSRRDAVSQVTFVKARETSPKAEKLPLASPTSPSQNSPPHVGLGKGRGAEVSCLHRTAANHRQSLPSSPKYHFLTLTRM